MASAGCVNTTVIVFGILELILAIGIIACGAANISNKSRLYKMYHGLWGGGLLAMNAAFAIYAGVKKARGFHIAHMVLSILALIFLIPGVSTIFAVEIISDVFYSYWTDPASCNGCFTSSSNSYSSALNTYSNVYSANYNSNNSYAQLSNSLSSFMCSDFLCNPNRNAVKMEYIAIVLGGIIFLCLIIAASFNCCAVCQCCGATTTLTPAPTVYPMNNGMNSNGYPMTGAGGYPNNGYPNNGYPSNPNQNLGWNGQDVAYSQQQAQNVQAYSTPPGQTSVIFI